MQFRATHKLGPNPVTVLILACVFLSTSEVDARPRAARQRTIRVTPAKNLAAIVRRARPNTTILLGPGTYKLRPQQPHGQAILIENKRNLTLTSSDPTRTRIELAPNTKFGFYIGSNVRNLSIKGFTISGTTPLKVNTHAIGNYSGTTNVHGVRFTDLRLEQIAVGISAATSESGIYEGVTIQGNTVAGTVGAKAGSGYGIHLENVKNATVSDNLIENATRHSIYLARAARKSNIRIERNLILDHNLDERQPRWYCAALVCSRASDTTVAHNLIVNPKTVALSVEPDEYKGWPTENINLINNQILGAHYIGVWVTTGTSCIGLGNSVTLNPAPVHPEWCRETSFFDYPRGKPTKSSLKEPHARWKSPDHIVQLGENLFVMTDGVLDKVTPRTWAFETCPRQWEGVRGIAGLENSSGKGKGRLYVVTDTAIYEVNTADWQTTSADGDWRNARFVTSAAGHIHVLKGDVLHVLSPGSLNSEGVTKHWPGTRWICALGNDLYLSCTQGRYRVDATTLEGVLMGPSHEKK